MPEFVVESYFSSEPASVAAQVTEIALAAERPSEQGAQVRFLCAIFLLEEEICFYLFEAASAEAVREAVTRACLRFERISEAISVRARARHDAHGLAEHAGQEHLSTAEGERILADERSQP